MIKGRFSFMGEVMGQFNRKESVWRQTKSTTARLVNNNVCESSAAEKGDRGRFERRLR